jgi:hypothetical protein
MTNKNTTLCKVAENIMRCTESFTEVFTLILRKYLLNNYSCIRHCKNNKEFKGEIDKIPDLKEL